jgi:phage shock protein PspC (stress-responsive transcriptional regulator)
MEKTITVNISGTVFHIEEKAYQALQRYLENVRGQFAGSPGSDEIMADIEARIAELFAERIQGRGMVVTLADVDHVIDVMGRPEDYTDGEEAHAGFAAGRSRGYKRLFRDPDDRWVAGVLSGLANYVSVDPIWFRVAFIALVLLGMGTPILLYIILWVLVPMASTAAERLMMEGEPVTVDNLKRAFEQGAQRVASEVEDLGRRFERSAPRAAETVRQGAGQVAHTAASVIKRIVGLVLLAVGVGLGLSLLGTVIGGSFLAYVTAGSDEPGLVELLAATHASAAHATWSVVALLLVTVIPVVGILIAGFQLLLDLRSPRWVGWTLSLIWIVALIALTWSAVYVVRDVRRSEPVRTTQVLEAPADGVLVLRRAEHPKFHLPSYDRLDGRMRGMELGIRVEADSIHGSWAQLDIRRSPDSAYHLMVERRAQAITGAISRERSARIVWHAAQRDGALHLSPWFAWPKADRVRGQRIVFVVQVPEGGSVYIDEGLEHMLDDVDNIDHVKTHDMVNKTWTMTPQGLTHQLDALPPRGPAHTDAPQLDADAPDAIPIHRTGALIRVTAQVTQRHWRMPDLFTLLRPRF